MLSQAGAWGEKGLSERIGMRAEANSISPVPLAKYSAISNPGEKKAIHPHSQPLVLVFRAFEVGHVSSALF